MPLCDIKSGAEVYVAAEITGLGVATFSFEAGCDDVDLSQLRSALVSHIDGRRVRSQVVMLSRTPGFLADPSRLARMLHPGFDDGTHAAGEQCKGCSTGPLCRPAALVVPPGAKPDMQEHAWDMASCGVVRAVFTDHEAAAAWATQKALVAQAADPFALVIHQASDR